MQNVETLHLPVVNFGNPVANNIGVASTDLLPSKQNRFKRLFDIALSITGLIVLSPLMLLIAVFTRLSSKGSIIFKQQRIGYKGKAFTIYKFRSMFVDAEKNGPALSSKYDMRVTKWGRIMRKWRLDELPQLWNILKGEMSFVGPRPERNFYIRLIAKQSDNFHLLLNVKPGLTSWGMVQYGYASSVDDMIHRMQYDLEYVGNKSLLFDMKILLYSLKTIFLGKGR
ncbi:MAG: sugar transferase [Bacteroidetes bacterium]|nr:sugar transferase [Bacteroidota bacterium]